MNHTLHLASYHSTFGIKNKIGRLLWNIVYWLLFRPFDLRLFKTWRVLLLKCFGANIKWSSHVYASAKIWAPWQLQMGAYATLGPGVRCYNQGGISIGSNTVVSQNVHICASTHDYNQPDFPLILKPITIGNGVWIAADAFIGPGVCIGNNAVVAARAVVVKQVEANDVVGGNPATFIKHRTHE